MANGRANARAIARGGSHLPRSITSRALQTRRDYMNNVMEGKIPMPAPGTPEARSLARAAALAKENRLKGTHPGADPRWEGAFKHYWYHNKEGDFE